MTAITRIDRIALCTRCKQPRLEGHTNCNCHQDHPDPCFREDYEELAGHLAHVQRIAGDNGDLAMQLAGRLAEIAEIAASVPPHADSGREWARVTTLASTGILP